MNYTNAVTNTTMETKGIAGYHLSTEQIQWLSDANVKKAFLSSHEDVIDVLEWFQGNVYHPGASDPLEKELIEFYLQGAEELVAKLQTAKKGWEARLLFRPLKQPISLDRIPEDVHGEIMSYMSPVVRLENLRQKYTNAFLLGKLRKKSIPQLQYIARKYEDVVYERAVWGDIDMMMAGDIEEEVGEIGEELFPHATKPKRVAHIVQLYLVVENCLMNSLMKRSTYDEFAELVIKMLHLLVVLCNAPSKLPKKPRGCHDARVIPSTV